MQVPLLHEGEDKTLRLVLAALNEPLDLEMANTAINQRKQLQGETFWMDSFVGPATQPEGVQQNTPFPYEIDVLSLRELGYWNFMSIMVIDLRLFRDTPGENALKRLFKTEAYQNTVRVRYVTGKLIGKGLTFTFHVLDTEVLRNQEACEISNVPQHVVLSVISVGDRVWLFSTDYSGVVTGLRQGVPGTYVQPAGVTHVRVSFDNGDRPDEWFPVTSLPFILVNTCVFFPVCFVSFFLSSLTALPNVVRYATPMCPSGTKWPPQTLRSQAESLRSPAEAVLAGTTLDLVAVVVPRKCGP